MSIPYVIWQAAIANRFTQLIQTCQDHSIPKQSHLLSIARASTSTLPAELSAVLAASSHLLKRGHVTSTYIV